MTSSSSGTGGTGASGPIAGKKITYQMLLNGNIGDSKPNNPPR